MWFGLALLSALFQVLRNMSMKHLGRSLDDTINVWGRFTFLLPFTAGFVLWQGIPVEAAKQAEVLFALGIGALVFQERARVRAILPGSLILLLGMVLLHLRG